MQVPPILPPSNFNYSDWDAQPNRQQMLKDYQAFNQDLADLSQALGSKDIGKAELALGRLMTLMNPSSPNSLYAAAENNPAVQPTLNYMQGMIEAMNEEFASGNYAGCNTLATGSGMKAALGDLFEFITKDS